MEVGRQTSLSPRAISRDISRDRDYFPEILARFSSSCSLPRSPVSKARQDVEKNFILFGELPDETQPAPEVSYSSPSAWKRLESMDTLFPFRDASLGRNMSIPLSLTMPDSLHRVLSAIPLPPDSLHRTASSIPLPPDASPPLTPTGGAGAFKTFPSSSGLTGAIQGVGLSDLHVPQLGSERGPSRRSSMSGLPLPIHHIPLPLSQVDLLPQGSELPSSASTTSDNRHSHSHSHPHSSHGHAAHSQNHSHNSHNNSHPHSRSHSQEVDVYFTAPPGATLSHNTLGLGSSVYINPLPQVSQETNDEYHHTSPPKPNTTNNNNNNVPTSNNNSSLPPSSDGSGPPVGNTGVYTKEERQQKIERYREKKKRRCFKKKILYACRKQFADARPRVGGRFVSAKDVGKNSVPSTPPSSPYQTPGIAVTGQAPSLSAAPVPPPPIVIPSASLPSIPPSPSSIPSPLSLLNSLLPPPPPGVSSSPSPPPSGPGGVLASLSAMRPLPIPRFDKMAAVRPSPRSVSAPSGGGIVTDSGFLV